MDKVKLVLSIIGGILMTFFQQYGLILGLVSIVVLMDFITGLVKAKIIGDSWSSQKGTKGLWKKLAFFLALFFGIFFDYAIPYILAAGFSVAMPFNLPVGLTVGVYIIINESISVCENLHESGVTLPEFIRNVLTGAKKKMDEEDETLL